jgi:DNA-binding LacI/PurR family transcriptional regulator
VSEATRRRVQAAAREHAYVPNPALARQSSLRRGERPRMPLALVLQRNPNWPPGPADYAEQVGRIAASLGYRLSVHVQDATLPVERLNALLWNTGTEAVLLGPVYDSELVEELEWDRHCVVALEAGLVTPPCHLVLPDIGRAIVRAAELCVERGYRRIGLVQFAEPVRPVDHLERYGAAHLCSATLNRGGVRFEAVDVDSIDARPAIAWARRFRPDAVIAQTATVYWRLRDAGWAMGRDVGFVSLNLESAAAQPPVSGFVMDHLKTVSVALRLLDGQVRAFERGRPAIPTRQLVELPWFEGQTLPPRRAGSDPRRPAR